MIWVEQKPIQYEAVQTNVTVELRRIQLVSTDETLKPGRLLFCFIFKALLFSEQQDRGYLVYNIRKR